MDGASEQLGRTGIEVERRATTPIAGAIAGMLFAVLFGAGVIMIRTTMTALAEGTGDWLETDAPRLRFAVGLMPFAGLFFLWFIAVARQRLGRFEDQFFATVFLGSGLLFLAMTFVAAASAASIAVSYAKTSADFATSDTYLFAHTMVTQIFSVYALRMAAVFLISQATLWLRTGVMPRWMAFLTFAVALVLLVIVTQVWWVILVFPAWVFLVSTYILVAYLTGRRGPASVHPPGAPDGIDP